MLSSAAKFIREHLLLSFAIFVTTLVYFRFLFFGHISWDDPEMVFKNNAVKTFDLRALFSEHYVGNYLPITMIFHALGWLFFNHSNGGHHAMNILFHLVNGIFVYHLSRRLFADKRIAAISSVIFLLHPLQLESVAWIGELKNVLSTTFYLSAVLAYLKWLEQKNRQAYFLSFLLFVMGCLSKASVVVFPLVLICLDLFFYKNFSWRYFLNKIPFLLISLFLGWLNLQTQSADQFINHSHEFAYYQRLGLAGFALLNYLAHFLLPLNLSVIYPYPDVKPAILVPGYLTLLLLGTWIIFLLRKKNYVWLWIVLFILLNLILVLQFVPFGEVLYADRYAYIPVIGFAWMIGILVNKIKLSPVITSAVFMCGYGVLCFAHSDNWKSAMSLYESILRKYPKQFVALNSAGVESMMLNEDARALDYFNRAVNAAPYNYKGYYNRGLLYLKNKRPSLAIKSFNQSLALYDYQKAYVGRASAYYMSGDIPKAMNDANRALLVEAQNPKAHFVLGNCYNDLNQLDEALNEYNKSIALSGEEADFYFKRAIVYGKKQDFVSCLNDLLICTELRPDYYDAYYWKGVAKVNLKQDPCSDFEVAARHAIEPAIKALDKYCR